MKVGSESTLPPSHPGTGFAMELTWQLDSKEFFPEWFLERPFNPEGNGFELSITIFGGFVYSSLFCSSHRHSLGSNPTR